MKKILLFLSFLLMSIGVFGETLFHETFGDNSSSARDWSNEYSEKSGIGGVYNSVSYTVTHAKQS